MTNASPANISFVLQSILIPANAGRMRCPTLRIITEMNPTVMTRRSPNSTRGIPASRCNAKGRGDDKPEVGHANEERKTGMRAPDCPRER